ncbi:MAG: lytic polysaccharide monooxygenase [Granulosicoccus sp.]
MIIKTARKVDEEYSDKQIDSSEIKVSGKSMSIVAMLCILFTISSLPTTSYAHGWVEQSRNKLCAERKNVNCGSIVYEPQSVEGPDRFPESGPEDGTLAAGGSAAWVPLNEQSANRWTKAPITAGRNIFEWFFTANHVTGDWRYFITRQGWNPNQPLTRSQFDLAPFCVKNGGFMRPNVNTAHECFVPSRTGYHVVLAVWDVGDTTNSFYNAIDVSFDAGETAFGGSGSVPDSPEQPVPAPAPAPYDDYVDIGNIEASMDLDAADIVRLRLFSNAGELFGREYEITVGNVSNGNRNDWPAALARYINAQGGQLIAGISSSGNGEDAIPTQGRNDVFAKPSSGVVRTEIEFILAGTSATPTPPTDPGVLVGNYPDRLGSYKGSDRVVGTDGNQYECIVAGWCNIAPPYYAPGTGSDWQDAWRLTGMGNPGTPTVPDDGTTDAPVYPDGRGSYTNGTVVFGVDGAAYQCDIAGWCNNPSDFYYAPGAGLAFGEAWTKL